MGERYGVVLGLCLATALVGGGIGWWMGRTAAIATQEGQAGARFSRPRRFAWLIQLGESG